MYKPILQYDLEGNFLIDMELEEEAVNVKVIITSQYLQVKKLR